MRRLGLLVAIGVLVGGTGVAIASTDPARNQAIPIVGRVVPEPAQQSAPAAERAVQRIGAIEAATGLLERHGRLVGTRRELTFTYPDASYVKLHFGRMLLRPGDRVVVSDPSGGESYSYTGSELVDNWAMSITGDTAVMRLEQGSYDPLGLATRLAGLGVTVDKVARGFPDDAVQPAPETNPREDRAESICRGSDEKLDAVCYKSAHPVAYQRSKAVARMLINGIELCTTWRVGPSNRMFTNNHCASSAYDVQRSEVWFNYECAVCDGYAVLRSTKVWGDRLVATNSTLDYALFSVQNFDAISRFGFLELDPRRLRTGEELYIPQHPRGLPTMIAMSDPGEHSGNCAVDDPQYFGYEEGTDVSYFCDTEGGSSGSPVLSAVTHKVVALHHFGGCPNSGVRMDLIQREVARLL
jgi:lysyl endopeptidase